MEKEDSLTNFLEFGEQQPIEIPEEMPLMAIRDLIVFPSMIVPLFVGRDASVKAVNEAMAGERLIFLVAQKDPAKEHPTREDLYGVGVVAMIMNGKIRVFLANTINKLSNTCRSSKAAMVFDTEDYIVSCYIKYFLNLR